MSKERLIELQKYVPGKSTAQIAEKFRLNKRGVSMLQLNKNLYLPNIYGSSPMAKRAIIRNIDKINTYLTNEEELRKAISGYVKIPARNILIGAGIDGILNTLAKFLLKGGGETIIPVPTYEMYELITRVNEGIPRLMQRDENFRVSVSQVLSLINRKTKIIFICSPNNTTGNTMERKQLEEILKKTRALVVVDEALGEYAKGSVIPLIRKYENLLVLRTFSKIFGLAALRIGYGMTTSKKLLEDFNKTRLPFSINSLGIDAAIVALKDQEWLKKTIQKIKEGRKYILKNVKFHTYPSQANFALVNVAPLQAKDVLFQLLKQGVLVRDCDSSERLKKYFIRIKIGKTSQNKAMVKAVNNIYDKNFPKN